MKKPPVGAGSFQAERVMQPSSTLALSSRLTTGGASGTRGLVIQIRSPQGRVAAAISLFAIQFIPIRSSPGFDAGRAATVK
jgi:hypothetical protein